MDLVVQKFSGIAPRFDPNLEPGLARTAENCDLTSGKIKPYLAASLQQADTNNYDSLIKHAGSWVLGNDRFFCPWKINTLDLLFYLDSGTLKKKSAGATANAGQARLGAPTTVKRTVRTNLNDGATYKWTVSPSQFTKTDLADGLVYKWTLSASGINEYYLELLAGGDPGLAHPNYVELATVLITESSPGVLNADKWGYGDNDTLGYDTLYIRLASGADPDTLGAAQLYYCMAYTYYCEAFAGGDPGLAAPAEVEIGGVAGTAANEGTMPLDPGEWDYGDFDTLGYSTVYVRLSDGTDPDGKASGYVQHVANTGDVNGTVQYVLTTTRSVGGHVDESGPSTASTELITTYDQVRVTRPAIADANVTHWNIYRISSDSGEYQFVAQVLKATTYYDDILPDGDLDTSPTTWYTSDQGNEIIFDTAPTGLDGLIPEPLAGILFVWDGPTLRWSEPGYPDAWPSHYSMNFPSNIKRAIPFAGTVAVLTERGPFRVDGTHPELLQQSKMLGEEPCPGLAACKTPKGIMYLSDSGLTLFNLVETNVISDALFTETWFKANVDPDTAFLVDQDNILCLFHSGGLLVADLRTAPAIWYTRDLVATAAFRDDADGELYYIDSAGVQKLGGGSTYLTWTWRSGDLLMKSPLDKEWKEVEVRGSGTITLTLYVDDEQQATKALSWVKDRDRVLKFPEQTYGRAAQIQLAGTGEVQEVIVRAA